MPVAGAGGDEVTLTVGLLITVTTGLVTMVWKASRTHSVLIDLQTAFKRHRSIKNRRLAHLQARVDRLERIAALGAQRSNLEIEDPVPPPSNLYDEDGG